VALALLMLQLTSSGGTYPVQTTPASPGDPPAAADDLRRGGPPAHHRRGPAGTVTTGVLRCSATAWVAFVPTVLVALRSRRLTPSDLHPELVI